MDLNNLSMKKIRELIVFTAFLVIALWKFDIVIDVIKTIWDILSPFALGGAIAFVINVPMSFLEKKLFGKAKEKGTKAAGKFARPVSLLLTLTGTVSYTHLRDCRRCYLMIPGDHNRPDSGSDTFGNRCLRFFSWRIHHSDETQEDQMIFIFGS